MNINVHRIITSNFGVPDMHKLKVARGRGAYASFVKLFGMAPGEVVELVRRSGLRGRAGAGYPAGEKWSSVKNGEGRPVYLVVNADESEPGTFKDRAILERDPHLVIEGAVIAAYAIGAHKAFVYFRGEFQKQRQAFVAAVDEARHHGLLGKNINGSGFDCDMIIHRGAGAYVCGEETALLESLEGKRGWPRTRPPFPPEVGLFGCPTIVHNVETFSNLPFILSEGAQAFRKIGTERSPGTKLISVCGHVERPGVYEVEMGTPVAVFLAQCAGGTLEGRSLKAVMPGGTSVPVLTAKEALGARIDFESLADAGSMLGSGGMIVMDESACAVRVLADITRFYAHESCGECTPCREGSGWARKVVGRIEAGSGRPGDADLLVDIADGLKGRTICGMGNSLALPLKSFVTKFRDEFEEHIKLGRCPQDARYDKTYDRR